MTPDEAVHHEWLQPSSASSTFILSSSTSASSLIKHSRSDQLKENEQILSKYQRSQQQPITPVTILPQIKTPNNQQRNQPQQQQQRNGLAKDGSRIKSKLSTPVNELDEINSFPFSVLGSTNDLDSQKCQYYQQSQINIRKLSTTINNNNNNNPMQNSTLSNTSSSSSSSINSSSKYGNMPHSQSTNDVSAIFGRA